MDQKRYLLFWRYFCQAYFTLINPPYWSSKVDLACIINIGFSGTYPLDRSINYFSDALGILELFIWSAWRTGVSLGILVFFSCTWLNVGVWLRSFSACNLPTGTTAPVPTSCSETLPYNALSIRFQPICRCKCWEIIHTEPCLFPGSKPTCNPPSWFPSQAPSTAHHPISATLSRVHLISLTSY